MIRLMAESDLLAIHRLNQQELGYVTDKTALQKQMQNLFHCQRHFLYVAKKDDKVVGYVHATVYESLLTEQNWLNIMELAVLSDYQGQGIGKQLMQRIEQIALEKELGGIRLNSGESRVMAHRFYERIGYKNDKLQLRFTKQLRG